MTADRDVVVRVLHHYGDGGLETFAGTAAEVRAAVEARFRFLRHPDYRGRDLLDLVEAIDRCQAYSATIGSS